MSTHLPDQAVFRPTLPEGIGWEPFPAFPPSARLAVVVGDPSQAAPYVVRVKLPSGVKLMPHRHHEDRVYTVMSGVFYIGLGEEFDDGKLQAFPPGAVIVLPSGTPHFHWAKSGEYVTQVTAIGPISLEYLDPCWTAWRCWSPRDRPWQHHPCSRPRALSPTQASAPKKRCGGAGWARRLPARDPGPAGPARP